MTSSEFVKSFIESVELPYVERVLQLLDDGLKLQVGFEKEPYSQHTPFGVTVGYGYNTDDDLPNMATVLYLHEEVRKLGWFMSTETHLNFERNGEKPEFKSSLSHILKLNPADSRSGPLFGNIFGL